MNFYIISGGIDSLIHRSICRLIIWFLIPRFREGEFGGQFILPLDSIPELNAEPNNFPDGRFWLVNLNSDQPNIRFALASDESGESIRGVAAIYKVCTHLGCIYAWTATNDRFECPCHGSKYRLDGRRIEAPAPRSLDRFWLEFLDSDKNPIPDSQSKVVDDFYEPVVIPAGASFVRVDTGVRKRGLSQPLLCEFAGSCP